MSLYERLSQVQSTNPYFSKDLEKARKANKFIGRGSNKSSTNKYAVAAGDLANCGIYEKTDIIFVSAEGARGGRLPVDLQELDKAIAALATFVTDDHYNRQRSYNVGEREVQEHLLKSGYQEVAKGVWKAR